ncbi:hypothetical protein [Kitasatospora sp. DSM 101779]|uniref:hypothetical protein n=1 Tax=Kitasatospora sp. DSM 101779 TaxID=2853165 RepID=UPI0037EE6EC1|nr:hypothetical protein [Kitasatospora sp. DSM 101779]
MVLKHLSLDRMGSLPRYPAAQRPAHVISLDELRSSSLTVGTGSLGTADAWLVEQDGHGYLHHPAYNLTSLERPGPPDARQHSESLNSMESNSQEL